MGRAFEYRKARKLKRWGSMSRTFTRIGKEITMAVKAGGPDPTANSRLRALMSNAKAANMPKDTVERAIKKATDKDASDYKEVIYEGYAPGGIAVLGETATDNTTRTVANLRTHFNKNGGTLGITGMAYKGIFFTGLTLNAGANAGEANTAYGRDNFSMLMAGIANKTGYNIEFADGKFVIQPNLQLSYSFVNTFDKTFLISGSSINSLKILSFIAENSG